VRLWLHRTLPGVFREYFPLRTLNVLDVGCGTGSVVNQLVRAGASGTYLGVDLAARPEWRSSLDGGLSVEFAKFDARRLDALAGQFNAAAAIMAFEHFEDDVSVLCGLAERLVDGGVVVLAVPAPASRWYLGGRHCYRWYRAADLHALADEAELELVALLTRRSGAGLLVDGLRYALFTGAARGLRAAVYLRHLGKRERALARNPWLRDINMTLNSAWVSLAEGRVARSLAAALFRLDDALPGLDVAHVAVLRKPPDA
jgi:SAM-dependent methyltransferase